MTPDFNDIQALVRAGFGSLDGARYLLLRVADNAAAKAWLAQAEPTRSSDVGGGNTLDRVLQIAFTSAGLRALGFAEDELESLAPEFLDGMASDERRSHRLGDVGESGPENWQWGTQEREPHVLLILLAKVSQIEAWTDDISQTLLASGFSLVADFASTLTRDEKGVAREPFGFADGLSQPKVDWESKDIASPGADRNYRRTIAAGEVVLGYSNEYRAIAGDQTGPLTQQNGSYLVYRQLEQDVSGFWQWAVQAAGRENAIGLAERMVGRGIDGEPLPGLEAADASADFLFDADPHGQVCPFGAHIRRANPRIGDNPIPQRGFLRDFLSFLGLSGKASGDAVASARFHRILRRGRPYGEIASPEEAMGDGGGHGAAGLHFMCLNASLARQFEFVQGAWLESPTFGGLSQESDPLVGSRCPFPDDRRTDLFRYYDKEGTPRIAGDIPRFVKVLGGAYFFLPGIAGLRSIAAR
ncbi:hypothetical protein [uncultured Erythrobacter sp.]|uniref:Dyp-type peroxidase n=1 Tax=uncultured Erythrobacter sp. TaxID=263913 RepID=UPI002624DD5D|nr:hypothetical protein [uncultured Erythrobacter sp.]